MAKSTKSNKQLNRLAKNLKGENIGDRLAETIREIAFVLEGGIKVGITKLDAVDTGFMRSSTRINQLGRKSARVGPNADYSIYVHEGTRWMQPRRFIDMGVKLSGDKMEKVMERTGQKISVNIVRGV